MDLIYGQRVKSKWEEEILPQDSPIRRLAEEPEGAYILFRSYIDQHPPRKQSIVIAQHGLSHDYVYRLSSVYKWRARARRYDEMVADAELRGLLREKEEMAAGHLRALAKVRFLCEQNIDSLLKQCQDGEGRGAKLGPREIVAMLDRCVHYERLILGEATNRVEEKKPDLSRFTDEDLQTFQELMKRAYGDGGAENG